VTIKRKIIYKDGTWFPMLNHIGDLLGKLSAPELRLYIALCARGRGRARTVELSNVDVMQRAALDKDSLRPARDGLVSHGLIRAEPVDKRREHYSYEISGPAAPVVDEIHLRPQLIPREVLFGLPDSSDSVNVESTTLEMPTH
jgi:hypothetical protein